MTTSLELHLNRSLLNSDFDGYKLSLAQVPIVTENLKILVDRMVPDVNQYSLLHAKLYALHNHLIGEEGQPECVYFVDKELNIQKFFVDSELNQFSNVILWQVPSQRNRISGDYNVSLKFPSEQIAVIADGMGYLYVLDRGLKVTHDQWKVLFCGDVAGPDQNFVICDAIYKDVEKPELHLLLLSIGQRGADERHSTILHWITLIKSDDTWNQVALRELTVKGFVQYARFETTCEAVYTVSDSCCKFTLDSEKEVKKSPESIIEKRYTWTQSQDDITINFPLPKGASKNVLHIETENNQINVKYEEKVLLAGPLSQYIEGNMTTWTVEDGILKVVLQKSQNGLMWPEVVQGDLYGEHVLDEVLVDEIAERLAPFTSDTEVSPSSGTTFNSQQIEECDFECDKITTFERLCRETHDTTHKVNLGSHQVLLISDLDRNLSPSLGIRSDVDVCIWQPKVESGNFHMEHVGTLLAMGYIQASKQQMKFFTCSPDLSYSIICESSKHIFLYCQNKKVSSSELRNRTTGRRVSTMAQQQVISLPLNDEILGVHASNSYLYILGETFISALKL